MPATAAVAPTSTDPRRLDEAVARVREGAPRWARASLQERIALARSMLAGVDRTAERMVRDACAAKGLPFDTPLAGEEWLSSPYTTARLLRQIVHSLTTLSRTGNTPIGRTGETLDGRLSARIFAPDLLDAMLFSFIHGEVHFKEGVDAGRMHERRARFHKARSHDGKVCLVLGAGNINSIPPTDVASKLFNEGTACVLKMNPVNAYMGPILEDAFSEAIAKGFLAVVYGGAEEGAYLARHASVDEIHITGSTATHDALVWGPPGPEREERKARGIPLLRKEITSELGDVAPVIVVPGPWSDRALAFQAESVAGMVTQNASFACTAAQMLILPRGWKHRDAFLGHLERAMAATPARKAWYPGAAERYRRLVEGRPGVRRSAAGPGELPWTIVPGLAPAADDPLFRTEAFCALVGETSVGSEDPVEFLDAAVSFANGKLFGMLSANVIAPPRVLRDPSLRAALDRAVRRLRYGTVAVNCWASYAFVFGTSPWGGFPGQPLDDIRSGRGFVHNTLMLDPDDVETSVMWHPAVHPLKPPYFPTHRSTVPLGRGLVALETRRKWSALPG
ncbi:MAG TPA: aldehyde dehydrogenase family protein, partial [Anaeromyxobacteraceae bacterium]|nr:aldehyde dehydrogenase family protein [Anaeromyxobacteraceae bacterium]